MSGNKSVISRLLERYIAAGEHGGQLPIKHHSCACITGLEIFEPIRPAQILYPPEDDWINTCREASSSEIISRMVGMNGFYGSGRMVVIER